MTKDLTVNAPEHDNSLDKVVEAFDYSNGMMPYSEIGKYIGCSAQEARNICQRGLEKIRLQRAQDD